MEELAEEVLADPPGVLVRPGRVRGTGVLVLGGSSGAVEADRCRLLARHGATAMSIRWFGGPGQQDGTWEVPLETFTRALDRLAGECDRLALLGTSFGAEAALLVAAHDPRVAAVVAVAPTSVVWAGVTPHGRQTSHWTQCGEPLPFVPFDETWRPDADPPAYRGCYEASLRAATGRREQAAIPVEQIAGELVLVAGGDDQVWPSDDFASAIAARRSAHGLATTVLTHPAAGHRVVLPGERPVRRGMALARGGTPEADLELGRRAWPHLVTALGLS
ncbi:MAG TPA: acyl-CoA thioester hydrolase/BAAT C-terminal domain-containing protein [Marmoricola sp.]|nr:acyl-CoA thioester hydrolase/BAAT C-terminal domain-containing protein [Marmoricola sp.]